MTINNDPDIDNSLEAEDISAIDDDAILDYRYYLVGERPLRVGYVAPYLAVVAEILNTKTKNFEIDNTYMDRAAMALDIIEIEENAFIDACHKKGVKPPAKKSYSSY